MSRYLILASFTLAIFALGTAVRSQGDEATEKENETFQKQLLEIAKNYKTWGRIDDEARWTPTFCRLPNPAVARFSASDDEASHGQKLYSLFAKRRDAYLDLTQAERRKADAGTKVHTGNSSHAADAPANESQAGQVIVKESWTVKPAEKIVLDAQGDPPSVMLGEDDHFSPYAKRDGKWFMADEKFALFVMFRVDPKTPGSDEGWIYGTVSADGKKVTSVGLIDSCIKCHAEAPHGRLFGLTR